MSRFAATGFPVADKIIAPSNCHFLGGDFFISFLHPHGARDNKRRFYPSFWKTVVFCSFTIKSFGDFKKFHFLENFFEKFFHEANMIMADSECCHLKENF